MDLKFFYRTFLIVACKIFFWLCRNVCLWKTLLTEKKIVENFLVCRKFLWSCRSFLWKISFTVENFTICGKFPWPSNFFCRKSPWQWIISMFTEIFLGSGKVFWLWKTCILDCRKNNRSNNFETIKTYNLNLEQKLSSCTFFVVDNQYYIQ